MNTQTRTPAGMSATSTFTSPPTGLVQRKCACDGAAGPSGECAECRKKRLTGDARLPVQTKLTLGQPGDKYEQEADRVADAVMRMSEPRVQRQDEPEEDEEKLQAKPVAGRISPLVQRQEQEEEKEDLEEPLQSKPLTAKSDAGQAPEVASELEQSVNALRGSGGQPLDADVRTFMEPRFGHDFSQVRVHTDCRAAETARSLNARAFTVGRDVAFGAGQYTVATDAGKRLLAHELTHVVQQRPDRAPSAR